MTVKEAENEALAELEKLNEQLMEEDDEADALFGHEAARMDFEEVLLTFLKNVGCDKLIREYADSMDRWGL